MVAPLSLTWTSVQSLCTVPVWWFDRLNCVCTCAQVATNATTLFTCLHLLHFVYQKTVGIKIKLTQTLARALTVHCTVESITYLAPSLWSSSMFGQSSASCRPCSFLIVRKSEGIVWHLIQQWWQYCHSVSDVHNLKNGSGLAASQKSDVPPASTSVLSVGRRSSIL